MIPLSSQQLAGVLDIVCAKYSCTPDTLSFPCHIVDDLYLSCINGVRYLQKITPPLPGPNVYSYVVYVDDVPVFSQSTMKGAVTLANTLTQLLFPARCIRVMYGERKVIEWQHIAVDIWIGR